MLNFFGLETPDVDVVVPTINTPGYVYAFDSNHERNLWIEEDWPHRHAIKSKLARALMSRQIYLNLPSEERDKTSEYKIAEQNGIDDIIGMYTAIM